MRMHPEVIERQMELSRAHLTEIMERAQTVAARPAVLFEAIEELSSALEELHVAVEMIREQSEQVISTTAQTAVEEERREHRQLLDLAPDGYLVTTLDGRIEHANRAAARLLGIHERFLIRKPLAACVDQKDRQAFHLWTRALQDGDGPRSRTLRLSGRRSGPIDAVVTATPRRDAGGRLTGALWVIQQISDPERREGAQPVSPERVPKSRGLESLAALAGGLVRDFNNVLTVILGNASSALLDLPEESAVRSALEQIERACLRGADLTHQLLIYSGGGPLVAQAMDLSGAIEGISHELESVVRRTGRLDLALAADLPPIEANPDLVRQLVMSLVESATKALKGPGGVVQVTTRLVEADRELLGSFRSGDGLPEGWYVLLEVQDVGTRVDEATWAAAHRIARQHRGAVGAIGCPGGGTTVRVLFPVAKAKTAAEDPALPTSRT